MFKNLEDINELLDKHEQYRAGCLNLIASENYASQSIRNLLTSDFGNRYGCYSGTNPEAREYRGNRYIHEFELKTQELVGEVFRAKYVDLRPIGGHIAGVAVILGLLSPGDLVLEIHLRDWGHGLAALMVEAPHFNHTLRLDAIPFDENKVVNLNKLIELIFKKRPRMIIFGGSGMLFPEPIAEVKLIAEKMGILVGHDASHVTGLIAGGVYPNPLDQGADVMFGSTHKSFPGPQGGFIVTRNEELFNSIGKVMASLVTSHHINRLPALAAAMLEMQKFGRDYGAQIIKNSKALGKAMEESGFQVIGSGMGYTETHLILVDVSEFGSGLEISNRLEQADILCSDDFGQLDRELRIGTAEATRRGLEEAEMGNIAEFFKRVIIDKEDPLSVKPDVNDFIRNYPGCRYCL